MPEFGAYSEVGKLRKVIVHRPGLEMRRLTPTNAAELLFDDHGGDRWWTGGDDAAQCGVGAVLELRAGVCGIARPLRWIVKRGGLRRHYRDGVVPSGV